MTYQPFLPEVASGSIEAPHVAVALRRHLRREVSLSYDVIVVTAGAVTRTLPVPGIAEVAFRLKHVEEAVAVRDEFLTALDRAADLPKGSARTRALTVTFVGVASPRHRCGHPQSGGRAHLPLTASQSRSDCGHR